LRKQGDKVRVTAQLIQVSDGFHLWSETYDGDVSDVFALQERIARAIADKLEVVLKGESAQRIVPLATTNPEAYALYLQATGIFNRREGARFADAIAQLEQAIALDPKFARAHARLAAVMSIAPTYMKVDPHVTQEAVEEHARIASELDPGLAEPYAALGQSYSRQRRFLDARKAFDRALELDPDDTTSTFWSATEQMMTGYRAEAIRLLDRLLAIDPMLPTALLWRGVSYAYDNNWVMAERLLKRAADAGLAFAGSGLALVSDARGDKAKAIEQLTAAFKALDTGLPQEAAEVLAAGVVGDAQARATATGMIDAYLATNPPIVPGTAVYSLIRMNEPARAITVSRDRPTSNDALYMGLLWSPYGEAMRTRPEFPDYARATGFTQVWDRYGAPDDCRRVAIGDYACQ
jgi:tetratricopeptide (TPR) repeat protein